MEVRDGFIVGIFNYCDSWCAACPFTSRCRLFADKAEMESRLDPNFKPIVDAPPLPEDVTPMPGWMQALLNEANADALVSQSHPEEVRHEVPSSLQDLLQRAEDYADWVLAWSRTHHDFENFSDPADPRAVVGWFYLMISAKIARAVRGFAEDDLERDWPSDHDGSAKVALLAIERSHRAWLDMISGGIASMEDAEPFTRQLVSLRSQIESVFPKARAFVRPAFDEPEAVARLLASEDFRE